MRLWFIAIFFITFCLTLQLGLIDLIEGAKSASNMSSKMRARGRKRTSKHHDETIEVSKSSSYDKYDSDLILKPIAETSKSSNQKSKKQEEEEEKKKIEEKITKIISSGIHPIERYDPEEYKRQSSTLLLYNTYPDFSCNGKIKPIYHVTIPRLKKDVLDWSWDKISNYHVIGLGEVVAPTAGQFLMKGPINDTSWSFFDGTSSRLFDESSLPSTQKQLNLISNSVYSSYIPKDWSIKESRHVGLTSDPTIHPYPLSKRLLDMSPLSIENYEASLKNKIYDWRTAFAVIGVYKPEECIEWSFSDTRVFHSRLSARLKKLSKSSPAFNSSSSSAAIIKMKGTFYDVQVSNLIETNLEHPSTKIQTRRDRKDRQDRESLIPNLISTSNITHYYTSTSYTGESEWDVVGFYSSNSSLSQAIGVDVSNEWSAEVGEDEDQFILFGQKIATSNSPSIGGRLIRPSSIKSAIIQICPLKDFDGRFSEFGMNGRSFEGWGEILEMVDGEMFHKGVD